MSRTHHPKFRLRRYILRDQDYGGHLRRSYRLERDLFVDGIIEYEDVPDGDYVHYKILHELDAHERHHRGRRRSERERGIERAHRRVLRGWKHLTIVVKNWKLSFSQIML